LQVVDILVLLVGSLLQLQHFLFQLSLSRSVSNTMNGPLVLKLSALQMDCWKDDLFNIGRDLATDRFEDSPRRVRVDHQLGSVLLQQIQEGF
jgi:hypothetical protein